MSLLAGAEFVVGLGLIAASVFFTLLFTVVPLGDNSKPPSFVRLTVIPMFILLLAVGGFASLLTSLRVI